MPEFEVSTWTALVSKMAELASSTPFSSAHWGNSTIKITQDIDLNDEAPSGTSTQFNFTADYNSTNYTIVIDGKQTDGSNGVIRNLRTSISSPNYILAYANSIMPQYAPKIITHFKNIDFVNLILSGSSFAGVASGSSVFSNCGFIFENCRFVGSRSGSAYLLNVTFGITLTSCYVNLPWNGAGQSSGLNYISLIPPNTSAATNAIANYCRFNEKYSGWIYPTLGSSSQSGFQRYYSCSYFKMSGCRIEGKMTVPWYEVNDGDGEMRLYSPIMSAQNLAAYSPSAQNVFDVTLTADSNAPASGTAANSVSLGGFSYVVRKDCKLPNGTVCDYDIVSKDSFDGSSSTPAPLFAEPSQMKDAQWLSDNGFDIIVQ